MHLECYSLSAVTVRIYMFVSSRTNLHTCTLPLAGSRSPLVKYARGSHIGFSSTSQTRSCALRMPRYVTFTKCPEVLRCRRPTTGTTIGFLHELFALFGVVHYVVSDKGSQFTSAEFKEFCKIFQIKHVTTLRYYPRSNGQAERFADTLKRALKKAPGTPMDKALQQFLQVYRITPNPNTPLAVSPAETMFARKIRSVFDKLLPKQNKLRKTTLVPKKKKKVQPGRKKFTLKNIKITRPVENVE